MTNKSIFAALLLFLFSGFISLQAQQNEKWKNATPEQRTEKRVQKLQKELSLTEEQAAKARELILIREKSHQNARNENKESLKKFNDDLNAVLTPDQRQKRAAMLRDRKAKIHERKSDTKGEK
jgi:Spy/CpxP family protein refolding chaperone